MKWTEPTDRWGTEFDWLAHDKDGWVATVSTAGFGPVPEVVEQRLDLVDGAVAALDALPSTGVARELSSQDGDHADWTRMAERGFYAYDWHDSLGPYQCVAVPSKPVRLLDLPPAVQTVARLVMFPLVFADTTVIAPSSG